MNESKDIIKKIFKLSNIEFKFIDTDDSSVSSEYPFRKELIFVDTLGKYQRVWFNPDNDNSFRMKYDKVFVTSEETDNEDTIYSAILEYIKENKFYNICKSDEDENDYVVFKIPSFSCNSELQIKLDMMV